MWEVNVPTVTFSFFVNGTLGGLNFPKFGFYCLVLFSLFYIYIYFIFIIINVPFVPSVP